MIHQAFAENAARHRLLEGFLSRLGRHDAHEAFALRGGMLIRHWFEGLGRPARDIDLVCALEFDAEAMRSRISEILETEVSDGVRFDAQRFRIDPIHVTSLHPGMRLFAAGRAELGEGRASYGEISVDFTFDMPVFPETRRETLNVARGEVELSACPASMLVGRKLQVLAQLGHRHWRPKDLIDVWWILQRGAISTDELGTAVERSFAEFDHAGLDDLMRATWWSESRSTIRWARYARRLPSAARVPPERMAAEIRERLHPLLRR